MKQKKSEFDYKKIGKTEKELILKLANENIEIRSYILEVGKKITNTEELRSLSNLYTTRLEACQHPKMIPVYEAYIAACAAIYKILA